MFSVHQGMFSTSGVFSTSGDIIEYIEGCLVHRKDIMMHVGGYYDACGAYQEYIRGFSVHWGDTMSTTGDIMSHIKLSTV